MLPSYATRPGQGSHAVGWPFPWLLLRYSGMAAGWACRRGQWPALLVAVVLTLAACAAQEELPPPLSVTAVPWGPQEEARYLLLDTKGREAGRGTLTIQRQDSGWLLGQRYEGPGATDEIALTAKADLSPVRMERRVEDQEGELTIEALYGGGNLAITWRSGEEERHRELTVLPDTYDNATSLFLWRAIPFAPDYEASYSSLTSVLRVEKPRRVSVRLRVTAREVIEVPAGSFEAWRVEAQAPDRRHVAWYAVAGSHPLVQYDSGTILFRLESLTPKP